MTEQGILVRAIVNEEDHDWAIHRITKLMDATTPLDSAEGYELDALVTLVDRYESEHFPIATPAPVAFIQFMMEQKGLTRKDLEPMIGSRARVSEVLSGKRALTLNMIRKLHKGLDIAPEYLLGTATESIKSRPRQTKQTVSRTLPKTKTQHLGHVSPKVKSAHAV